MGYKSNMDRLWKSMKRQNPDVNDNIPLHDTTIEAESSNVEVTNQSPVLTSPPAPNDQPFYNDDSNNDSNNSIVEDTPFENVDETVNVDDYHSIITVQDESLVTVEDTIVRTHSHHIESSFPDEISFLRTLEKYEEEHSTNEDLHTRETLSFELMQIIDNAGAPRYLYDSVKTWLKSQNKISFNPSSDLISRKFLLQKLHARFRCPDIEVKQIHGNDVYRFPFVEMLQDLLDATGNDLHIIKKEDVSQEDQSFISCSELWNSTWMKDTFKMDAYNNFDNEHDIMLPLIMYTDKTGIDALQRYSLEPLIFTLTAIPRESREKHVLWRHLGFIPPVLKTEQSSNSNDKNQDQKQLQLYHDMLQYLIEDLVNAQKNPPTVCIKLDGKKVYLKAHIPLMIIMGDQKSQDTICGRKHANSGGAGRVHRSCMCSYLTVDQPFHRCIDVCQTTIRNLMQLSLRNENEIQEIALQYSNSDPTERLRIMTYLKNQQKMNASILQFPFTQHTIRNAFDDVNFGSWQAGVYKATFDDFMHSTESGIFEYIAELVFSGMTRTENARVESAIRKHLLSIRSSARSTYPRWRLKEGFSTVARTTCIEKVGLIQILSLSLQYEDVASILHNAHSRQRKKYINFLDRNKSTADDKSFPQKLQKRSRKTTSSQNQDSILEKENDEMRKNSPFFWEKHFSNTLTNEQVHSKLVTMIKHGFDINLLDSLDLLQIHSMLSHVTFSTTLMYPTKDIPCFYNHCIQDSEVIIPQPLMEKALKAFCYPPNNLSSSIMDLNRHVTIEGTVNKHYKRKQPIANVGNTAAILSRDTNSFMYFLEYVLSFHAFARYSYSLPRELQQDYELIDFGSHSTILYFEKMVYRGDESVDSRTTKVHANKRFGMNHLDLGTCMHADCQTGERLLKTKAKKISSTAQQRGNSIFEHQTMQRIRDQSVLTQFENHIQKQKFVEHSRGVSLQSKKEGASVRNIPNYRYVPHVDDMHKIWEVLDRHGKVIQMTETPIDPIILEALFRLEPHLRIYEIFSEMKLHDQSPVRATQDYCKSGPWYDFVNVKWSLDDDSQVILPARCLAFYRRPSQSNEEVPSSSPQELMALVHGADILLPNQRASRNPAQQSSFRNSLLTSHYKFEYEDNHKPRIHAISVSTIESTVLCIHHVPPGNSIFPLNSSLPHTGFMLVRPRNEWAYVWLAWNEVLRKLNKAATVQKNKRYVDLGNETLLKQVRQELQQKMKHLVPT